MAIADTRSQAHAVPFVLESSYGDDSTVVADGTVFPSGRVAVDWRNESGTELILSLDVLYSKFGRDPRVLWKHEDGTFSEAEPASLTDHA